MSNAILRFLDAGNLARGLRAPRRRARGLCGAACARSTGRCPRRMRPVTLVPASPSTATGGGTISP